MMKKIMFAIVVVAAVAILTGCNKTEVQWQNLTYQWEDAAGNRCEATVKVSPWINTKNQDYLDAAWDEVANDNVLPEANANSWDLEYYQLIGGDKFWATAEYSSFQEVQEIANIYYCVGEVSVDDPTVDAVWLSSCQQLMGEEYLSSTMSKVFSNGECQRTEPTWAKVEPNQKKITFVFAYFAENEDEYQPEIADTCFYVTGTDYDVQSKNQGEFRAFKLAIID